MSLPVAADRARTALVIGNSDYSTSPLRNPVNDANAIAEMLQANGFSVEKLLNAGQRQMEQAIRDFTGRLHKDSVGLFYFAGHGIEIDGENYLIPVDAEIETESDVPYEGVAVGRLLDGMQRSDNGLNLVVLDACRNNPYSRSFRSGTRGLAEMRPASGTMILYATEPGSVAADGEGKNGIFTEQLLRSMDQPGRDVETVFKETALAVNRITQGKQVPWFEGIILGYFYFVPTQAAAAPPAVPSAPQPPEPAAPAAPAAPALQDQPELLFWQSVERSGTEAAYAAYLEQWPEGHFAPLARMRVTDNEEPPVSGGGEEQAPATDDPMGNAEILSAFAGNTVEGYHHTKHFGFTRFYDPDGTLVQKTGKVERRGKWSAENNQLCEDFGKKKCRPVKREGGEIHKYRGDTHVVSYRVFTGETGSNPEPRTFAPKRSLTGNEYKELFCDTTFDGENLVNRVQFRAYVNADCDRVRIKLISGRRAGRIIDKYLKVYPNGDHCATSDGKEGCGKIKPMGDGVYRKYSLKTGKPLFTARNLVKGNRLGSN